MAIGKIVGLLVAVLLIGALGPTIFQSLTTLYNDGNVTGTVKVLVGVFGTLVAIGLLYMILKESGVKLGKK